ncbi:MAG: DUF262 domain-containing protein [Methanothrix sp.]|nr:DUF262 domain-containing protein [Methanothrix sp.]
MNAQQASLFQLLSVHRQFVIPIYQRPYSWKKRQREQLWEDILRVAKDPKIPSHFIGSLVYIQGKDSSEAQVSELMVIDGQQRLITVSLLLAALAKAILAKAMENPNNPDGYLIKKSEEIKELYLFHKFEEDDLHYRVKPTESDKKTYFLLMDGGKIDLSESRLTENYEFFEKKIGETGIDLVKLYEGIGKLMIVDVKLKRNEDDPQRIFESLNSTGLNLSKADLIRNFVLMGLEPEKQKDLYKTWSQMEQNFFNSKQSGHIDRFFRDYLTIKKNGIIPTFREIYFVFQRYYVDRSINEDIKNIVDDIYEYSKYYIYLQSTSKEDDKDATAKSIRSILNDIKDLKVDVAYPFLMEVYNDCIQELIGKGGLIEILKLIESYVFRRAICGIPTQGLNRIFATLSKELVRDKEHYLESFKAALLLKESYKRFPGNDEFMRELIVKDLYHFDRNYWLAKLENYEDEVVINVKELTVEHIMPQNPNLSENWIKELGNNWKEIQDRYLHTIGNLTLLPKEFQPKYSDRPFLEKRDMVDKETGNEIGYAHSKLRLNKGLGDIEHWNEKEIENRAANLSNLAVKVWPYPQLSTEILAKYGEKKRSITEVESTQEDFIVDEDID